MNVVQLTQPDEQLTFDDFWLLYPRRVAKKDARKAWDKLKTSQQMEALVALVDWRKVFAGRDEEKIPHASTWINGERWEDELPAEFRNQRYPSAEQTRMEIASARGERTQMPEKLRALLASLK